MLWPPVIERTNRRESELFPPFCLRRAIEPGEIMTKELIISANVHEKKVAILEDGVVTEFYVERRDENQGVVGNLYKGRVMKVLPGMQSAFVDIGLERDAFLYVSDFTEFMEEEEEIDFREAASERPARLDERQRRGEHQQRTALPARLVAETASLEEQAEAARIDDAVEHVAEIAVEKVIPPPPPDETPVEPVSQSGEAEAASVDEFEVASIGGEAFAPGFEIVEDEFESAVATAPADETAEEEAEPKPRRGRARRAADERDKTRTRKRQTSRKTQKGKRSQQEEDTSESSAEAIGAQHDEGRFERVTDDDSAQDPGEFLKDAIVQEKIIEEIHNAEYTTESSHAEPEPEWRVGSFRSQLDTSDFQRVVDESADEERSESREDETPAPAESDLTEYTSASPLRHVSGVVSAFYNRFRARPINDDSEGGGSGAENAGEGGRPEEPVDDSIESDAEGEIRDRGPRAEFAVRRGGRGRRGRRRQEQQPSATASAPEGESPQATADSTSGTDSANASDAPSDSSQVVAGDESSASVPEAPRASGARPRFERRNDQQRRSDTSSRRRPDRPTSPTISELLHEGQEILVQIAKEPIAKKGARITSHIALPGRYLVYMPTVNHVGVSRKIPNEGERIRLKRTVSALRERENAPGGFIARTACGGHTEQELHDDMRYLIRTWADVRKKAERSKSPSLVHRDLDLVQRILRDQLSEEFTAIRIDNEIEYARIVEFVNRVQPKLVKRVKLHVGNQPILEKHGVQPEIDKAVRPRVWLRSGGYIVINQTEALVAIDVNTGKFVGKSDKLEDTITRTNLEAAKEIVRQVRLRDLGGIIVIDFIDMEERKNRQKVMMALQQELSNDRAPSKILSINDFGLVAITRKRVKQSLERTLCTPCPYCQGAGMVKSSQTICFEILEQAKAISKQSSGNNDVMLRVSPHVAESLRTTESEVMEEVEAYFGTPVTIEPDPNLHQEQFDFAII
jgi:ribonuclease G